MSAIRIEKLHKRFGAHEVVKDLSLRVEAGQIYGLLGPNGSGKTTTLSCALGLMAPTSGSATVLGEPAKRLHKLKGRLGVVFDTAIALPGLTALENLEYVRRLLGHSRGRKAAEVLELVGLEHMAKQRVRAMSLGQQKRLAIAGAFLGEPELLVLDEPLSGLDTMGVRRMLRLFSRLRDEGLTLILSSHRLHEMQAVITHAGILFKGRIELSGSLTELLASDSGQLIVRATPLDKAREFLSARQGIELVGERELGGGHTAFTVQLGELPPERLNRELVEQGIEVSRLEQQEVSLQSVFEGIVDGHGAEEAQA